MCNGISASRTWITNSIKNLDKKKGFVYEEAVARRVSEKYCKIFLKTVNNSEKTSIKKSYKKWKI